MPQPVQYAVHDRVAVITIDNPPVNALGPGILDGIAAGVARAGLDPDVLASVVIGAGATFIAGADINVFRTLKSREQSLTRSETSHALLRRIAKVASSMVGLFVYKLDMDVTYTTFQSGVTVENLVEMWKASLPVTIFKFAMSPYENWQKLAWAGVFLITLGVLVLNILARVLFRNKQ